MDPSQVLKKPYARIVVPEADGSFTAQILEFPGCVASGDSSAEALAAVEEVAIDWIAATQEQGQDIPEPIDNARYSGKLVLRMSKGLHKRAAMAAERDAVSLNQFIVTCVAECVGARAASRRQIVMNTPNTYQTVNVLMLNGNGLGGWVTTDRQMVPARPQQQQLLVTSWGQHGS